MGYGGGALDRAEIGRKPWQRSWQDAAA